MSDQMIPATTTSSAQNPAAQNPAAQNPVKIQKMFSQIAPGYDLANTVLSLGIHHIWRKRVVRESGARPGNRILDCATGTGDLAFEFERSLLGKADILGSDFCAPMLEVASQKAKARGSKVRFETGDVTSLKHEDNSFDVATISFGIRNTRNPALALSELGRVVKPGGRVLVLEFGQPESFIFRKAYNFYSRHLLPVIGGWVSGNREAYRYLNESSEAFPSGSRFLNLAQSTGRFSETRYRALQGGIAYLYLLEVR